MGPIFNTKGMSPCQADALLARAYTRVLCKVLHEGYTSVAFPAISTGEFHFPPERAAAVALQAVCAFQAPRRMDVCLYAPGAPGVFLN